MSESTSTPDAKSEASVDDRVLHFRLINEIGRQADTTLFEVLLNGTVDHPAFGKMTITDWVWLGGSVGVRMSVSSPSKTTELSSVWLADHEPGTLSIAASPAGDKLLLKQREKAEELYQRQILKQQDEQERAEAEKRRLEQKAKRAEAKIEYDVKLTQLANAHQSHVIQALEHSTPGNYNLSIDTIVALAVEWVGATVPKISHGEQPALVADKYVTKGYELWSDADPWIRMAIIKHWTDAGFPLHAIQCSYQLQSTARDQLRIAILTSRFRTLSIYGMAEEAEKLGRSIYYEKGQLDKYLSFALWGHYRRWPHLDPEQKYREWLQQYFDDNEVWPQSATTDAHKQISHEERARILEFQLADH